MNWPDPLRTPDHDPRYRRGTDPQPCSSCGVDLRGTAPQIEGEPGRERTVTRCRSCEAVVAVHGGQVPAPHTPGGLQSTHANEPGSLRRGA